jgi:hypothetical protein
LLLLFSLSFGSWCYVCWLTSTNFG